MRLCLECRRFSGNVPICTNCGRSFGGRLCGGKKRHLNPRDARFCGECGSTALLDAADYVPFGWAVRLVVWGIILWLGWIGARWLIPGAGGLFQSATGYRDPLVWAIEKSSRFIVFFVVIYWLAGLLPGDLGKSLQRLMAGGVTSGLKFGGSLLKGLVSLLFRGVIGTVEGRKTK